MRQRVQRAVQHVGAASALLHVVTVQQQGGITAREAERRCRAINDFERHLVDQGTRIVKVFLHVSKEEQRARLQDRIDNPRKHWKVDLGDLETRKHFEEIMRLYDRAISATSTEYAPWYVVLADRKWLRDVVISELVVHVLEEMHPNYPPLHPEYASVTIE